MIDIFNHGPYTDLHRLNLDWILEVLREHEEKIQDLEERVKELEDEGGEPLA